MKKAILYQCALMILLTMVLLWTVPATAAHHEKAADAVKNVYVCGCGTAAKCDKVSAQPGNAPCGKPLIEKQVLKEDADNVYVCACPEGCQCGLSDSDPTKCACGKELRAYPKGAQMGCAHGMQPGGGCDKPCTQAMPADCGKNCASCPKKAAETK